MRSALTIAGSDSSGGAGIQADIKTMLANDVYAMSAITALTAQNTLGVSGIYEVSPEFLKLQLNAIFTDIYPDGVKIGMVPSGKLVHTISDVLIFEKAKNIVVDPVMLSTSGSELSGESAVKVIKERLLPIATLVTPNIPEAEVLSEMTIQCEEDIKKAAIKIHKTYGCNVLVKGGHGVNDANDLLCTDDGIKWFYGKRIANPNTHGTGCTLSSAICAFLAKGLDIDISIQKAKEYISGALNAMLNLGKGVGPLHHGWNIETINSPTKIQGNTI